MKTDLRVRIIMLLVSFFCTIDVCHAGCDSLSVVFWNVENFFDWKAEGTSDSEREFSSEGVRRWTRKRFYAKCNGIAKTLLLMSEEYGGIPDIVALAEVENRFVLSQLTGATSLRKLGYSIVHFDSPDHRGIDCALLYRRSRLHLKSASPKHLYDSCGAVTATRDILLAEFDSITVMVNHHPSKVGGGGRRRESAMSRMLSLCDSLEGRRILCVGDFNEDLWHDAESRGTIKYNGAWEKIDGFFSFGPLEVRENVFDSPFLTIEDRTFGGQKPRRTYNGLRYQGGISDHYPLYLQLFSGEKSGQPSGVDPRQAMH